MQYVNAVCRLVVGLLIAVASWTFAGDAAAQGTITASITGPQSVTEGDDGSTSVTFIISLSQSPFFPVTVVFGVVIEEGRAGTATPGADFRPLASGGDGPQTVRLRFNRFERAKQITLQVYGDTTDEHDETIIVALSGAVGVQIATGTATVRIIDDDEPPSLSIGDAETTAEGDDGQTDLTFPVSLSAASEKQVEVVYGDAGTGTATAGTDYTAPGPGTLTFAAGETSKTLAVSVTGDTTFEPDETVVVALSDPPANATLRTATGVGTIRNDDEAPPPRSDTKTSFTATSPTLTFTLTYTVGEAIQPHTLPAAEGDSPIDYDFGGVVPPGLSIDTDPGRRVLSGTPTAAGTWRVHWTATDVDDQTATLAVVIEVESSEEEERSRLAEVNRAWILPELSRATWGSVLDAVTGRLESSGPGSGVAHTMASALKAQEDAQDDEGLSWREIVAGRTFAVAPSVSGAGAGGEGVGGVSGGAVVWGGGSRRSLSLDRAALDWSGELFSAHAGVDAPLGGGIRGGLAASWIEGEIEYTDRVGGPAVAGEHESRLTMVHPYAGWSGADGSRLWGVLGYGQGEIEIVEAVIEERFGVQKGDSEFVGVAVGSSVPVVSAHGPVMSADGLALSVKASGEATRYSVADNGSMISAVSVDTRRLRLAAEARRTWALEDEGTLTPSFEVGLRWDGGDGETGVGVELGGGLEWASGGLSLAARGRALAAHRGDVEERAAALTARLDPGALGRGPRLTVAPEWRRLGADGRESADSRVEMGWGLPVHGGAGLLTPYAGLSFGEEDRSWKIGARAALGSRAVLSVETAQRRGAARIGILSSLRW